MLIVLFQYINIPKKNLHKKYFFFFFKLPKKSGSILYIYIFIGNTNTHTHGRTDLATTTQKHIHFYGCYFFAFSNRTASVSFVTKHFFFFIFLSFKLRFSPLFDYISLLLVCMLLLLWLRRFEGGNHLRHTHFYFFFLSVFVSKDQPSASSVSKVLIPNFQN